MKIKEKLERIYQEYLIKEINNWAVVLRKILRTVFQVDERT